MPEAWDWTGCTTYEFRTKRIRSRFRYRFVRELFDWTMEQAMAFLEKRRREADLKTTLVEIDCAILRTQKSMRLLVPKRDTRRNRYVDKLA